MVTHLENKKIDMIFNAFKSIITNYLHKGLQIMTIMANNEFVPQAELLYDISKAPTLNLTIANKNEPYIEWWICVENVDTQGIFHCENALTLPSQKQYFYTK